jgi:hypothetical protein
VTRHVTRPAPVCPAQTTYPGTFTRGQLRNPGLTDQSSITRFVEDNWILPRISASTDATAGSLDGLFDFGQSHGQSGGHPPTDEPFVLDPQSGRVTAG